MKENYFYKLVILVLTGFISHMKFYITDTLASKKIDSRLGKTDIKRGFKKIDTH